ncbi:MAG: hypothetical protein NCW75_09900 [Phycisphaera sp.]|nr:MAG: hypothetical protein NCW75_09900 [Phycisphaera sp.]
MLAQAGRGGGDMGQMLIWVGVLIVAVVIGTIILLMIRRWMENQRREDPGAFTTMEDMRAMVDRGEMSKEEYEQVREAMIAKVRGSQNAPKAGARATGGNRPRGEAGSTSER